MTLTVRQIRQIIRECGTSHADFVVDQFASQHGYQAAALLRIEVLIAEMAGRPNHVNPQS